jgi:aerobic-type carbon monoxide dehydrogenase small subunit (CoxS/CutS family)
MQLTVNGVVHEVRSPGLATLLHVLREELVVTSPKAGCQQGGCGSCTVLVDGEPRRSCLLPVAAVDGAEIRTVEGLGEPDQLSPVQAAFHEHYAAQCGFCTAGFVMAAEALVARADGEVQLDVEGPATLRAVLDTLEARYPMLRGTIRDHVTQRRRAFVRFFACMEDLSHERPDDPLPDAVATGAEPFVILGAMSGG